MNKDFLSDRLKVEDEIRQLVRRNKTQEAMDLAFVFIQHHNTECLIQIENVVYPLRKEDGKDATWPDINLERRIIEPIHLNIPLIWNLDTMFYLGAEFFMHAYQTASVIKNENFYCAENIECIQRLIQSKKNQCRTDEEANFMSSGTDSFIMEISLRGLNNILNESVKLNGQDMESITVRFQKILNNIFFSLANVKQESDAWTRPYRGNHRRPKPSTFVFDDNLVTEMEWQKKTLLRYFLNQAPLLGGLDGR